MQPSGIHEPGRYPLPELITLKFTKPADQMTPFEHLFVGQLLEELRRIKRNAN